MHTNHDTETLGHNSTFSKVDRYGWTVRDEPGVFLELSKRDLIVDDNYQRPSNEAKVLKIVNAWSWIACGVIIVASRNNKFYVVDGQHRVKAAMRRSDIQSLPCIVFETVSSVQEAEGFLQANTARKPMTGIDKFRAQLVTGDEAALLVQHLCESVGREIQASPGGHSVRCVSTMMRHANNAPETLERIWPLLHDLHRGITIKERVVDALMYIEGRMPNGESLANRKWRERVMRVGVEAISDGINKAAAFYKRGGAKVWALGAVEALNYKHRNRLVLEGMEPV